MSENQLEQIDQDKKDLIYDDQQSPLSKESHQINSLVLLDKYQDVEEENKDQGTTEKDEKKFYVFSDKYDVREAIHAGTWYSSIQNELKIQINCWLEMAKSDINSISELKALLVPHAGYAYSGPTAGWAYKYLKKFQPKNKLKVFLFGPCHYVYVTSCCLTKLKTYETPLGNIKVDQEVIKSLKSEGYFEDSDKDAEEEEHSLEMQLPFLAHILGVDNFTLIPIMVGSLDTKLEENYGKIFAKYFDMDDTLFVISTDFCHWGQKFAFTHHTQSDGEIFESIEKLDQRAMEHIELHDIEKFQDYLKETENNICGKHIISMLLHCIQNSSNSHMIETKFIRYAQSYLVRDKKDSSVSYGAAITFLED